MAATPTCDSGPTLIRHFSGHSDSISALAFHPTEEKLLTTSLDCNIILWNYKKYERVIKFPGHTKSVHDVSWSPLSGSYFVTASTDQYVRIWSSKLCGKTKVLHAHTSGVRTVDYDPSGKYFVTGSDDKSLKLWTAKDLNFHRSFTGHTNWVRCARVAPYNNMIASCADDKMVKIWDMETGKCLHTFQQNSGTPRFVTWHPDTPMISIALSSNSVKLYDTREKELIQFYRNHVEPVNCVSFHPNGKFMLTASDDGTMKICDLMEGRYIYSIDSQRGAAKAVAFSRNGELFASGNGKDLLLWKSNLSDEGSTLESSAEVKREDETPGPKECLHPKCLIDDMNNKENEISQLSHQNIE